MSYCHQSVLNKRKLNFSVGAMVWLYSVFNLGTRWVWVVNVMALGKRLGTCCTGGWVCPMASLDGVENLASTKL